MKKNIFTVFFLFSIICTNAQVVKVKTESIQDLNIQINLLKNEIEYLKQSIINLDNNYKNIVYENNKNYDKINNAIIFLGQDINKLFKGYNKEMPTKINSDRLGCLVTTIGQKYQGGVLAYILQSGDPGYEPNIKHGLIVATIDQSERIRWFNGAYVNTDAIGTSIGSGFTNTNKIINVQGAPITSYAAGIARSYNGGGYNDWFLPSKDELDKLRININAIGVFPTNILYWSSTQIDKSSAWVSYFNYVNFSPGGGDGTEGTQRVRAIRAF